MKVIGDTLKACLQDRQAGIDRSTLLALLCRVMHAVRTTLTARQVHKRDAAHLASPCKHTMTID